MTQHSSYSVSLCASLITKVFSRVHLQTADSSEKNANMSSLSAERVSPLLFVLINHAASVESPQAVGVLAAKWRHMLALL